MSTSPRPTPVRRIVVVTDAAGGTSAISGLARGVASRLGAGVHPLAVRASARAAPRQSDGGTTVVAGVPGIEIVRFAEAVAADLIVLPRTEADGVARPPGQDLVGAVVRRAEVPCLVLPAGQSRLVAMHVALDGSERGMQAMSVAWALRNLREGGIAAIFVDPPVSGGRGSSVAVPSTIGERLTRRIAEIVHPARAPALIQRGGDVVEQTLAGLTAGAGDLVVVGIRRGGAADVTESTGNGRRILAAAPCAVLTVPL